MCLILLLRWAIGERWIGIALIHTGLHLLLLPALVMLPLCLVLRLPRLSILLIPTVLTWVMTYGGAFLPRSIDIPEDAPRLTLLTYNVHAERNIFEPMLQLIREANANVVVLQELSVEAAAQFERDLVGIYPYQALHPVADNPYHGRGVLSQYPLLEDHAWPVEYPVPFRLQRVVFEVDQPITLYNMHAPPSYPIWGEGFDPIPRRQQISALIELAAQDTTAVIFAGDFNMSDMDENYQRIVSQYIDSYRAVGWGLGFSNPDWTHEQSREGPAFVPLYQRLDYIFHSTNLVSVEARVWPESGGSDHRPLYAVLAF